MGLHQGHWHSQRVGGGPPGHSLPTSASSWAGTACSIWGSSAHPSWAPSDPVQPHGAGPHADAPASYTCNSWRRLRSLPDYHVSPTCYSPLLCTLVACAVYQYSSIHKTAHINKSVKRLESYQEKCLGKRVIRDSQANAINSVFRDKSRILWQKSLNCDVLSNLLYLLLNLWN